jgi:proteasome beta subunit
MDENLKKHVLTTGTSLVGIVCKDGVVMAGDKKTTLGGQIVSNKDTSKVLLVNDYLILSGTGIASDIQVSTRVIRAQLKLKQLQDKERPDIKEAANIIAMMSYQNVRKPSMVPFMAGLMVGGINKDGTAGLYSVGIDGSISKVKDYDANISSGMPYILGLLERQYEEGMSIEEGTALAIEAIKAASERDTASGYGVDVFTITKDGIKQVSKQTAKAVYKETN